MDTVPVLKLLVWLAHMVFQNRVAFLRFFLLLGGGLLSTFGARIATIPGAGALGCLVLSFVAAHGWRQQRTQHQTVRSLPSVPTSAMTNNIIHYSGVYFYLSSCITLVSL